MQTVTVHVMKSALLWFGHRKREMLTDDELRNGQIKIIRQVKTMVEHIKK